MISWLLSSSTGTQSKSVSEIMDIQIKAVGIFLASDLGVRTCGKGRKVFLAVVLPLTYGLGHERKGWHHEQNALARSPDSFCNP